RAGVEGTLVLSRHHRLCHFCTAGMPAPAAVDPECLLPFDADQERSIAHPYLLAVDPEEVEPRLLRPGDHCVRQFLLLFSCQYFDLNRVNAYCLWSGPGRECHKASDRFYCICFNCHAGMLPLQVKNRPVSPGIVRQVRMPGRK